MPDRPARKSAESKIRTYLIAESIRPGSTLEGLRLNLIKVSRRPQGNASAEQPTVWTLIEFEAAEPPDRLATELSKVLDSPGWYTDFAWRDEKFVIFPNRVFRYARGDRARHQEAADYARSMGVPPQQADWEE
jgi:hypothetical protein